MRKLVNLGTETAQRHTVLFQDDELIVYLRYFPTIQRWTIGAEWRGVRVYNKSLAVGVLHIRNFNLPFDFYCTDNSGNGLDPFQLTDLSSGRCSLYLVDPDDMRDIRGVEVPL